MVSDSVGLTVGHSVSPLLDVGVLLLIILDERSGLIDEGSLADVIGLGWNRLAGGKGETEEKACPEPAREAPLVREGDHRRHSSGILEVKKEDTSDST
jgi:hypothetical protein